MKNVIIICSALAFIGNTIKSFVKGSKKDALVYIVNVLIGITIIYIILQAVTVNEMPNIDFEIDSNMSYSKIKEEAFEEIIDNAENEIENTITSYIISKFDLTQVRCDVEICAENMNVISAIIYLNSGEEIISGYNIKKQLEKEFNMEVEVYFI